MDTDLNVRVARLIEELRNLQDELSRPTSDQQTGLASARLPLGVARELKAMVDGLRLFLWAYLDTWFGGTDVQDKLQQIRIDAAADMLRLLDQSFHQGGVPKTPQAQRLCQQILNMADLARGGAQL